MGKNSRSESIGTSFGDILKNNEKIAAQFDIPDEEQYKKSSGKKQSQSNAGHGSNKKVHYLLINKGPHAPYNFVPVRETKKKPDEKVVLEDPCQVKYSEISDNIYSGELRYSFTAQTPIFVGDGGEVFYRNKDGKYAIPGSTMRGLIRSNAQILGFSSVRDDIDDYNLMYRAVAGGALQKAYADTLGQKTKTINDHQMTVLEKVKAGYISREGSKYYLYNNIGDANNTFKDSATNYYVVNERDVLEERGVKKKDFKDLIPLFQNKDVEPSFIKYYRIKDKKKTRKVYETEEEFAKFNQEEYKDQIKGVGYKGTPNPNYKPYSEHVFYWENNGRIYSVTKVGNEQNKQDKMEGYVISSGWMQEKKAFYVIPQIDEGSKKEIPKEDIRAYQIDYNRKEKTIPEEARSFYQLPKEGEIRPVFYIEIGKKLYFGYTPRLRLMYDHTIMDGLNKTEDMPIDFAKMMFGFSSEENARKSKVFFTDAILQGEVQKEGKKELTLSEPKPTSYLEYLKQNEGKDSVTYNSEDMQLRGVKQYWLQEGTSDGQYLKDNGKEAIKSKFHPLKAGSEFSGTIRFQNLSKEELGLLLWSVFLEEDSQMNLGKAKAYGYGRIEIDRDHVDLCLLNPKAAYAANLDDMLKTPFTHKSEEEKQEFINAYQAYAKETLGVNDIKGDPVIRDFLAMKSGSHLLSGRKVEYMTLDEYSQFKQENNPLPDVSKVYEFEDDHKKQ